MNAGRYGRSSSVLKELLTLDPANPEAKRLFATLQLRLGSLVTARNAFQALTDEALERQDYWLAESLLREYLVAGPRCVPFVEKLGSVFELKGDLDAAVEEYVKAVEILVEDPDSEQPDFAARLVTKIAQLSPHNPVLLHLESLLRQAKEHPRDEMPMDEDGTRPRLAPGLSGLDQPATDVEFRIPPAEASSDHERARLPWEEEADDIVVPQQPTAGQDAGASTSSQDVPEQPVQLVGLGTLPVPHDVEIAATHALLSSDRPAPPSPENTLAVAEPESVQRKWSTVPIPESPLSADPRVAEIGQEEVPPASSIGDTALIPAQLKDGVERPGAQLNVIPEPAEMGETSSGLTELRLQEGPTDQDLLPGSRPEPTPLGGGLTATEESPSVEILLRQENSESDRPNEAVPPPMPWEQVQEIRLESMPVETADRLVVEEVNEDLIAGILQQIDLRERLAGELMGAAILEVPDHPLASEPAALPELEPVLDVPSTVSIGKRDEAEIALVTPPADPLPDAPSMPCVTEPKEPFDAAPASEIVAEGSPPATLVEEAFDRPVETSQPGDIAIQSAWLDTAPTLALPQDTDTAVGSAAQIESSEIVRTREDSSREENTSDSSWPLPESEEAPTAGMPTYPSYLDQARVVADPVVPAIQEAAVKDSDYSGTETLLVGETVPESRIGSEPQLITDLEGSPPGYSEPEIVEAADPLSVVGEGTAASPDLADRYGNRSEHERHRQAGALEMGPSIGPEEQLPEAPPISESWVAEPATPFQCRLVPTIADEASREEGATTQPWPVHLRSRSESEQPAGSFAPLESRRHEDEPVAARPAPVTEPSSNLIATLEPATDRTLAQKEASVQFQDSRKPLATVGLTDSTVRPASRPVTATLSRFFLRGALFIRSCFATAHAVAVTLISLTLLSMGCAILLVGGLGLVWLGLEEKPNSAFQDLVAARPQLTEDPNRNGALFLMGFAAPESKDPIQVGLAIQHEQSGLGAANGCVTEDDPTIPHTGQVSAPSLARWYREEVPSILFRDKATTVKDWVRTRSMSMTRYQKWLSLPFDDTGYGQPATPDCRLILDVHRLFVAEGFAQGLEPGIERLEADLPTWRGLLRKAKTLGTKMLAVAAVNDDARVVSGLLGMPELDARSLMRLAKLVSPLDSAEQSLRWPMQHEFLLAKQRIEMTSRADRHPARPWYVAGVALMPLPDQRILNAYADYYEDLIKSVETARTMPTGLSPYSHIRTPAVRLVDYLLNPVNNILEVPPGPAWEQPIGQIRETDALLRLVSLQAWIRKGPVDGDVKTRVAKAGQNFYDPFTGYPMLINQATNRLYSVGADGKDDDAVAQKDVSVRLSTAGAPPSLSAASPTSTSSR